MRLIYTSSFGRRNQSARLRRISRVESVTTRSLAIPEFSQRFAVVVSVLRLTLLATVAQKRMRVKKEAKRPGHAGVAKSGDGKNQKAVGTTREICSHTSFYAATAAAAAGERSSFFGGGLKKSANVIAARTEAKSGTRNRFLKSVTPSCVNTFWINFGQMELANKAPRPRITALNKP